MILFLIPKTMQLYKSFIATSVNLIFTGIAFNGFFKNYLFFCINFKYSSTFS